MVLEFVASLAELIELNVGDGGARGVSRGKDARDARLFCLISSCD